MRTSLCKFLEIVTCVEWRVKRHTPLALSSLRWLRLCCAVRLRHRRARTSPTRFVFYDYFDCCNESKTEHLPFFILFGINGGSLSEEEWAVWPAIDIHNFRAKNIIKSLSQGYTLSVLRASPQRKKLSPLIQWHCLSREGKLVAEGLI